MHDTRHLEQRLNRRRLVTANLTLFAAVVTALGVVGLFSTGVLLYTDWFIADPLLLLMLWSVGLTLHAGGALLESGAWPARRDAVVREEVLAAAERDGLSADEAVELHKRMAKQIRNRSLAPLILFATALGHTVIWAGGGLVLLGLAWFGMPIALQGFLPDLLALALLGSAGLGLLLPVLLLWNHRHRNSTSVEDYYHTTLKHKRSTRLDDLAEASVDEEGEIVAPRKRRDS